MTATTTTPTYKLFTALTLAALSVAIALAMLPTGSAGATACYTPSALNFTSERGALWVNGNSFKLKGASWFGFETSNAAVHGLWSVSYTSLLDFLANNGFNAIRLPFSLSLALNDASPSGVNYGANSDLQGLSSLQVMDKIIQAAASRGLLIMLDLHSFAPDTFLSDGLWYNGANPESKVITGWTKMLTRYQNQWNVIAADLKNEPFSTTWGTGNTNTDWNLAAARIANTLASTVSSRFLIFVEGTANSPSCTDNCFYGENIMGALSNPVQLNNPWKLVYSPHVYGPNVYNQAYFSAGNFPANMPAIWEKHWGFAAAATGNAVVLGEWGGPYSGKDATWMTSLVSYLTSKGMTDQFFWCLNPNSGDTGGLVQNDWATPESAKLTMLAGLVPSPTKFSVNAQGQVCVTGSNVVQASASPSPSKQTAPPAQTSASPSPSKQPAKASASPSPSKAGGSSGGGGGGGNTPSSQFTFASGASGWWFAVTIPGSTSVQVNCGNGQGFAALSPGWASNMWIFSPANGSPCTSTMSFIVNGGAAQTVSAPF